MSRLKPDGRQWKNRRARIIARDGYRCVDCGTPGDTSTLTIDHIVPRTRGGTNAEANLRSLCAACHRDVTVSWVPGIGYISPRGLRLMAADLMRKREQFPVKATRTRLVARYIREVHYRATAKGEVQS